MSTRAEAALAEQLAEVRRSFIRSLEPRILRLRELLAESAGENWTPETRAEIQAIAHKLAGSCASFGLEKLGDAAVVLENKLMDAKAEPSVCLDRDLEELIVLCTLAVL